MPSILLAIEGISGGGGGEVTQLSNGAAVAMTRNHLTEQRAPSVSLKVSFPLWP